MKNINIGLDMGIASVGWAIYDQEGQKFLDRGVKIFNQANSAADRRSNRALRRRYHRQFHRIERFNRLLEKNNINYQQTQDTNLLEKRIKGLTQEISQQEVLNILRFFLKYRGYNPVGNDTRENSYKKEYPNLYACEIQKIIEDETGSYRGLDFPFLMADFLKEIEELLKTQTKYHSFLNEEFLNSYCDILTSRRKFWEGPGGPKKNQLTPFGRYRNKEDLKKFKNDSVYRRYLYEELIKDCSVYVGEKSAPVDSYYAQRFNFLNDMLNLSIKEETLEKIRENNPEIDQKFRKKNKDILGLSMDTINNIQNEILSSNKHFKTILKNETELEITDLTGYRLKPNGDIDITKFKTLKSILNKLLKESKLYLKILNSILINEDQKLSDIESVEKYVENLIYHLTVVPQSNIEEVIHDKFKDITVDELKILKKIKLSGEYHSYSKKALKIYLDLMEKNEMNSSTVERKFPELIKSNVKKHKIDNYFKDSKTIKMSNNLIDDLVASPQVKKSLRKAITVVNDIQKYYSKEKGYNVAYIVVESNKELLSKRAVEDYIKNQVGNETVRKKAEKEYEQNNHGIINKDKFIEKYILLEENNHKCVYCDENITLENMDIEHIIPYSKSQDDSFANKVASCKSCNQDEKGNKTPFQFLSETKFKEMQKRIEKLKLSSQKISNLLFTGDINKYEKRFISRNLRDTSYATKEMKNQLELYQEALKEKRNIDKTFNVLTMPPKITGLVRKTIGDIKDRDNKYHHAYDASICAYYPETNFGKLSNEIQNEPDKYWKENNFRQFISNDVKKVFLPQDIIAQLKIIDYTNTKFNFEVKKSVNTQLFNANVNKVVINENNKQKYQKIDYIDDIYSDNNVKSLEEKLEINKPSSKKLAIKGKDPETFEWLQKIFREYKDKKYTYVYLDETGEEKVKEENIKNPFVHYCAEQNEIDPQDFKISKHGLRPKSKKNKIRPIIKRLSFAIKVTRPVLADKEYKNIKLNNHVMHDSAAQAYTVVYQDINTKKFLFLPMPTFLFDLKTNKLREDYQNNAYYKQLKDELMGTAQVEEIMKIRKGEYLRIVKKKDKKTLEGKFSHYDKSTKVLDFSSLLREGKIIFTPSDLKIEKIPIYGLGRILDQNKDK